MVEVLVVLSVIVVLLALILPAVLSARASNHLIACRNNLANIGRALHGYEAVHHTFPTPIPANSELQRRRHSAKLTGNQHYSVHARLLPYLGESALYALIDFQQPQAWVWDPGRYEDPGRNKGVVMRTRVALFLCPADSQRSDIRPGNSYRICMDPEIGYSFGPPDEQVTGPFLKLWSLGPQDFPDGLGRTVAMSERIMGGWDSSSYSRRRDIVYTGLAEILSTSPTEETLLAACRAVADSGDNFYPYSGATWFYSAYEQTWYNHMVTPNSPVPDCSTSRLSSPGISTSSNRGIHSASSFHRGGVNCLYMDGAADFTSDAIDRSVWRALATRNGSD